MSYECGEEPEGSSWIQFNPRFYVIALVFYCLMWKWLSFFPGLPFSGRKP